MAATLEQKIEKVQKDLAEKIQELASLRSQRTLEPVPDYEFLSAETGAAISLSELFDDKEQLILVHNMGAQCPGCTAWADGFNGVYEHLRSRAAFVVSTPDPISTQRKVISLRSWRFPMVSIKDTAFAHAMGFTGADEGHGTFKPGISTFKKLPDQKMVRLTFAPFGPGDTFFSPFHLFDLLEGGRGEWFPQLRY